MLEKAWISVSRMLVELWSFKHHSCEVLGKNEEQVLEISGKVILVLNWQGIWLNCEQVFCGKQKLQVMKLDGQRRRFLRSIEGAAWIFLITYSKMRKETDDLWGKKNFVRLKGTKTGKLGTLPIYKYSKNEKACSENTKGVAKKSI